MWCCKKIEALHHWRPIRVGNSLRWEKLELLLSLSAGACFHVYPSTTTTVCIHVRHASRLLLTCTGIDVVY